MISPKAAAAIKRTLDLEGRYSDHPNDPGGETWFGFSKRHHPQTFAAIAAAPTIPEKIQLATAAYHRAFWIPMQCEIMPAPLDAQVFDAAVLTGPCTASKFLQRALRIHTPLLIIDGAIGPKTREALIHCKDKHIRQLSAWFSYFFADHLHALGTNTNLSPFLWGWGSRILPP